MHGGIPLIIDKSSLQNLTGEEGIWLGKYFDIILTPTLFEELRAGLEKSYRDGREPEHEVKTLAAKLPTYASTVNLDHMTLCVHDLMGHIVHMDGRPIVGNAREVVTSQGERGYFIDEQSELKSLRNWSEGIFSDEDRTAARQWRDGKARIDLRTLVESLAWTRAHTGQLKQDADALTLIDSLLGDRAHSQKLLEIILDILVIPRVMRPRIVQKWKSAGRPMIGLYAPYALYVARVDMLFYFLLARGLLSPDDPSDRIDLSYLYYLPFGKVFSSSDKLHKRLSAHFITDRLYVDGRDLKESISVVRGYYENNPSEKVRASYPPLEGEFWISSLYDRLRPGWRTQAAKGPVKITPEMNEKVMKHLKPMLDAISALDKPEN